MCDGITAGYNMLLATEGIECSSAYTKDHEWTVATLDGVVWHIDATMGFPYLPPELMWRYQNASQEKLDAFRNGQFDVEYFTKLSAIHDEILDYYADGN